jgi:hypothetical protein
VLTLIGLLLTGGCGGPDASTPAVASALSPNADAKALLRKAQDALEQAGGYRLRVEQSNLVLQRWGGSDGGEVTVNGDGSQARAVLARNGEQDARYTIVLVDGYTYFKRSTCDQSFRVPGGTSDVLRPFLFARTDALANATDARIEDGQIRATVEVLGPVAIELDAAARPKRIRGTVSGRDLIWTFEAWGTKPHVSKPSGAQDRGPGGIPC